MECHPVIITQSSSSSNYRCGSRSRKKYQLLVLDQNAKLEDLEKDVVVVHYFQPVITVQVINFINPKP